MQANHEFNGPDCRAIDWSTRNHSEKGFAHRDKGKCYEHVFKPRKCLVGGRSKHGKVKCEQFVNTNGDVDRRIDGGLKEQRHQPIYQSQPAIPHNNLPFFTTETVRKVKPESKPVKVSMGISRKVG